MLDTDVLVRWLVDSKKLSREQLRVIRGAVRRCEPLALSAITLRDIAVLFGEGSGRSKVSAQELLAALGPGSEFHVVPIDVEIATEIAAMGDSLRDPADRAIVATARIHRLRLVTSDRRIVESKLVPVVE
ncbi:MAG: type II toxin-antitoxin system VapC family toxin [Bryobacteraceae bacterium]